MMLRGAGLVVLLLLGMRGAWSDEAASLGRLFTTPTERALIEAQRRAPPAPLPVAPEPEPEPAPEPIVEIPPKPLDPVRLDGLVRRNGRNVAAWMNGQCTDQAGSRIDGAAVALGATEADVPIVIEGARQQVRLKPGQVFDPARDTVHEQYDLGGQDRP